MAGVKFDITGNANGFIGATRQVEAAAEQMVRGVTNDGKALDDMFKRIAGSMATIGAGLSASALTKQIFDIRSEFQQLEIAFGTMLKSKEKANKLMKDAAEFAATTPFDLKGVAAGIKQNLAYGASVDNVIDEMRMLGDVAAGVSMPLNDLVYLYGTLRTSGRVATVDIRQFAGRGIPIYEELAKVLGVAKDEIAGLVTAGKVGFADIEQAFKNMTSAGGMFNNLMSDQSKSLGGKYSNLTDNIEMMFNEIGQSQEGVFSDAIDLASKLVENYKEIGRVLSVVVATYGTYKAALIAVAAVEKAQVAVQSVKKFIELAKVMKTATAAQEAFNIAAMANPYVLAAAALAALVTGVIAFTKHKKAAADAQKEASREVANEVNEVNTLAAKLRDSNTKEEERVKALERLNEIAPEVVNGIDTERDSLQKLNEQLDEYNTLKQVEIALKASTQYIDFSESIQSLNDLKSDMEAKKAEIVNVWTDMSTLIRQAIDSGDISKDLADYFESFMYDPSLDFADKIQKVRYAGAGNDKFKDDAKFLRNIFHSTRSDVSDYMQTVADMTNAETKYTNAVVALRERISKTIAQFYSDAEEAKKVEKIMLQALGLAKAGGDEGDSDADEKKVTEKQKKEAYKRKQAEIKSKEELAKLRKNLNAKVAKADIDSMEDGYAKSLKVLKYNLQQELDAVEQQRNDLLKKKKDEALKSWLAEDPEGRKEYQFVYTAELSPEKEKIFAQMGEQAQIEFNKGREKIEQQFGKEAEFTTRQFEIDAMSEGASKDAAQRKLDNERELHNLEMQRDAYIEAAKAAHILAEQKKAAADPTYMMKMFDVSKANADFDKVVENTEARQTDDELNKQKESWNRYLIAYGNYEEKKKAIREKYEMLIAKASTEGDVAIYEKQQAEELFNLEVQYQNTTNSIVALFGDMKKKSADELKALANEAEKALEFIKDGEYVSDNPFGITKEQFDLIKNSPDELDKISQAIIGLRSQAIALENPIDKIVEGFKKMSDAIKETGEANEALEEIKSGVSGVMQIFGFVSDSISSLGEAIGSEGLQKAADAIDSSMNVVNSAMSGAELGASIGGPWGAVIGGALGLATSLVTEISKAKDAIKQARIDDLIEKNELLDKSYESLADDVEKAYSVDASKLIDQQNILLEQKKKNLELMIAEEKAKKNVDEDQVKEWESQIRSIETSIDDNAEKAKEAILGISFDDFRDNFLDALLYMEKGVEGLSKDIEEDIRKAMYKALLADDEFEEQLQSLYTELAEAVEAGDTREIDRLKAAILNLYDEQEEKAREIDEKIGYEADSTREASERGIAQASQDSVDELNGRMTAIQSHTFSINERVGNLVNLTSQILAKITSIDGNTARLEVIEEYISLLKSDVSDILTRGIKIKA